MYTGERQMHPEIKLPFASDIRFFGPGTVSLLKEIDKTGNVREACENCGFSYSKGWTIIRKSEGRLGYKIVDRQAGGAGGGTALVTEKGHDLLAAYEELLDELNALAQDRFSSLMDEYKLTDESGRE